MIERFKSVVGYEGRYEISNKGQVKSLLRNGKIMKPFMNRNGYLLIHISLNGTCKNISIHKLVASAFIPNLENKPQVNHINGIKTDNRLENLEWCTQSENMQHLYHILGYVSKTIGKRFNTKVRAVNQIDPKTNIIINTFYSTMDAAVYLTGKQSMRSNINRAARIGVLTRGFKWEYVQQTELPIDIDALHNKVAALQPNTNF